MSVLFSAEIPSKRSCSCPDVPIQTDWCRVSACLGYVHIISLSVVTRLRRSETTTNNVRLLLLLWIFSRARHELVFYGICLPSISSVDDNTAIQRHPLNKGVVAERLGNILAQSMRVFKLRNGNIYVSHSQDEFSFFSPLTVDPVALELEFSASNCCPAERRDWP